MPDDKSKTAADIMKQTKEDELDLQIKDIEFKSTMGCLSLIRFISDQMETLPVPIIH